MVPVEGLQRQVVAAVEQIVGATADASPLARVLASLAPDAAAGVRQALITAVATGLGPRQTAALVKKSFGIPLKRALTIARTEHLRAFRESSRQAWAQQRDVVQGWLWLAALGIRPFDAAPSPALSGSTPRAHEGRLRRAWRRLLFDSLFAAPGAAVAVGFIGLDQERASPLAYAGAALLGVVVLGSLRVLWGRLPRISSSFRGF